MSSCVFGKGGSCGPRLWSPVCGYKVFPVRRRTPAPTPLPGHPSAALAAPLLGTCLCPTAHSSPMMEGPLSFHALGSMTWEAPWTPLPSPRPRCPDSTTFGGNSECAHLVTLPRPPGPGHRAGPRSHLCSVLPPRDRSPRSSQRDPLEAKVRSCDFPSALPCLPSQGEARTVPLSRPPPSCSPCPCSRWGFRKPPHACKAVHLTRHVFLQPLTSLAATRPPCPGPHPPFLFGSAGSWCARAGFFLVAGRGFSLWRTGSRSARFGAGGSRAPEHRLRGLFTAEPPGKPPYAPVPHLVPSVPQCL
ncbi:keratinocyte proline-rich protein-like [Moschus berezovskii]|uniref:keratinocyte proline-rich protein-like n=1 Tax=Moschus berezovskii TaxID=68408 RepID=UPI0024451F4B|nr:keratinocyte proline-rich protein-like [Moschus berezovskii]